MRNETAHIVQMMKATGPDQTNVIARWKGLVEEWASRTYQNPDAAAVRAWLPLWQPRSFYTAVELAPIWPALAIATGSTNRWPAVLKSARRLEHELDFHRLPRLPNPWREYFICERVYFWKRATIGQISQEFENAQR